MKLCSIVILSYNQRDYTEACLESIRKYTEVPYEIIVVDNASDQETVEFLKEQDDIRLILNEENKGFAGGCNQGIREAKGDYIMLLNNDTIVTYRWLSNMIELLESDDNIGMVGPLTNSTVGKQMIEVPYGDDIKQMQEFAYANAEQDRKPWRTLRLVAFCVLIRKSIFDQVGFLDESFAIGNYEDDDFNIRVLQAGIQMYVCRKSFIHHFMNISFTKNNLPREQIMMKNKLILENKWQHMDWNYHAVFNQWMLKQIISYSPEKILHLGCGLGALEIELRDRIPQIECVGMESHPIRCRIASTFLDQCYSLQDKSDIKRQIGNEKYKVIIIEGIVEKYGIELLEILKENLLKGGIIVLRIFNSRHITTVERCVTGQVGGDLICASSDEFRYQYSEKVAETIAGFDYQILNVLEVKKNLSCIQEGLYGRLQEAGEDIEKMKVYNRIYTLRKSNG